MIDVHQAALESANVAYHEFLQCYRKNAQTVYGFVEGKQDPLFYRGFVEDVLPEGWRVHFIPAGSKKKVLQARRVVDWRRFSVRRICFFVDRDLSDFLECDGVEHGNVFVTCNYSIENYLVDFRVFRRVLEEIMGFVSLSPDEVDEVRVLYEEELAQFRALMSPVMVQLVIWHRESKRPCFGDLDLKKWFVFEGGRAVLRSGYDSLPERMSELASCLNLELSTEHDFRSVEIEFQKKGGEQRFVRGKFLLWFLVELAKAIHGSALTVFGKPSPKMHNTLGVTNAMTHFAPRAKCPQRLQEFLEKTYVEYSSQAENTSNEIA